MSLDGNATLPSSSMLSSRITPNNSNPDPDNELQFLLRKLARLNGDQYVNPRSPRQVSDLLYGGGSMSSGNRANQSVPKGPTDKTTLLQIINGGQRNKSKNGAFDTPPEDVERQKQVAKLVLQCRELMGLTNINSDGIFARESFGERMSRKPARTSKGSRLHSDQTMRVASFSTSASDSVARVEKEGGKSSEESGDDVAATTAAIGSTQQHETDTNEKTSSVIASDILSSSVYPMSPYDKMVRDLFVAVEDTLDKEGDALSGTMTLDPYWMDPLLSLTKSSARSLVKQLQSSTCPMGYDPAASPFSSLSSNITTTSAAPVKKETLLNFVRTQKALYFPDTVLLVRVGDFYESYGVDAVLLVEHCGLNPMASKARAGCPWRNVQATLDGLTNAGFRVAVYEEWNGEDDELFSEEVVEANIAGGSKGSRLKTRYLAQVVSSANPTYMHGLVLNDNDSATDDSPSVSQGDNGLSSSPGRSYVGVIETNRGYTLVEVSAEERTAMISERLTAEAVSCRLAAYPPADPLFYVPPSDDVHNGRRSDRLPFLPWRQSAASISPQIPWQNCGYQMGRKVRVKTLPQSLVVSPSPGLSDVARAKQTIVSAFLRLEDDSATKTSKKDVGGPLLPKRNERRRVTHEDFVVITPSESEGSDSFTQSTASLPLHLETATQLGLMGDPAIPPLISSLLPDSAPSSTRRFLRRWLLIPPPPDIADSMSQLVRVLKEDSTALPSLNAPTLTGKVTSLIRAGQASAAVYRDILSALDSSSELLFLDDRDTGVEAGSSLINPLLRILEYDTGLGTTTAASLRDRLLDAMRIIEDVVSTHTMEDDELQNVDTDNQSESISYFGDVVPFAFYERNELIWRGRVKPAALEQSHSVPEAARKLAEAIAVNFWGIETLIYDEKGDIDLSDAKETKSPIVQDIFNNIIAIRAKPSWATKSSDYYHPRDRNGKILKTRYTTERVDLAVSEYVDACDNARKEVMSVLTRLSYKLVDGDHLSSILQASHLNLILSTAANHAASSNAKGWNTAKIYDESGDDSAGHFESVWPYWMDRTNSVPNTFEFDGLFLLTAPNMSGKSTLMRSTAAAALLIASGLCAPVGKGSFIRRFDSLFVRGASADVPTEDKSAFGSEMGDVACILRSCGNRSLVFVDEIGRGTSPTDGTSLAGAILENMAERGMSGMFATHLHGILNIPYSSDASSRIRKKRMAICEDNDGQLKWTYTLEEGECTNSLALLTAAKFGLPESILKRAEELKGVEYDIGSTPSFQYLRSTTPTTNFDRATAILEEVVGQGTASVHIPPSFMAPPSFEGSSCVYILKIGGESNNSMYYVGETDSLARRLSQHRAKGDQWSSLSAVAIQIEGGKTSARNIESLVIQRLAKSGFNLASVADGTTIRSLGKRSN
eukprot:scaffold2946_cov209-Alexandrium_tamarense.AAC.4